MSEGYDLVVIGGGPGGYTAAIRASQLGSRVALVEQAELGGTCTNRGCIPTKALAATAHLLARCQAADEMGVRVEGRVSLDFARAAARRDEVVATLRGGIEKLIAAHGVALIRGRGRLAGAGAVRVGEDEYRARSVILATGSTPAELPSLPFDGQRVLSSDHLLAAAELPGSLAIVGGGVIGCEFASIYRAFGVEVCVIELLDRLLPTLDPALSRALAKTFRQAGIRVLTGTAVQGVEQSERGVSLRLPDGGSLDAEQVLVATGRRALSADLGLEQLGVDCERGCVTADDRMRTSAEGVYAIGDLVGRTWLAHAAAREGEVAAACALGRDERMSYRAVPSVVYTRPELASVGLMPGRAREQGIELRTGRFLYQASGKALCDGVADGRVEILASADGKKVLGGWVAGHEAGVLIAEIAAAVELELSPAQLADRIHAHPTLSEMLAEAAADTLGRAIHRAPTRR
ncbi:MAG: dihydrolipoyl dehydrogenase [Deltaproteobacteria bacterium]|nr:dihydrolipoyl dehydrogenase [Deltaproteobacteria bacterium]